MMDPDQVRQMTGAVSRLMADRLGARGATLGERIANRGGALPARVRRAAEVLAEAEAMAGVPKRARMIDLKAVARAHATCVKYLRRLNRSERRLGRVLDTAAAVVFGLVVLSVGIVLVLRWRGFL